MKPLPLLMTALVLSLPSFASAQQHVAATPHLSPEKELATFKLPPGFAAQLVAAEPQIAKPMNIAFDAKGRIWATTSTEYPYSAGANGKDRVMILEDFAADGKARKVTAFAESLDIPIGILPLPDCKSAIVFSIPSVYLIKDTDGDGKADEKTVLLSVFGTRDTHGMTNSFMLGLDGWVYACHGFSNDSTVRGRDGSQIKMNSGNVYRFRPDGTQVEYFSHGQVNPFGLTFDLWGNLYTADCHSMPVTQNIRGAYYNSFGKPHDGLGYGPNMINHDHGSTALCGLSYYHAPEFPPEYRDGVFLGNVVTNRVHFDRIDYEGSTPKAIQRPDFMTSSDPWFRPVDVKVGPDGAIYIADFYNRIIGHYEVPLNHPGRDRTSGRIWRVAYNGDKKETAPPFTDRLAATVEQLVKDLDHPNREVQLFSAQELIRRGEKVAWPERLSPVAMANSLYVRQRLGQLGDDMLKIAIQAEDAIVRAHAYRVMMTRPRDAVYPLMTEIVKGVGDAHPQVRRACVELLGQVGMFDAKNSPLLAIWQQTDPADTHLIHTIRIALRDQLQAAHAWEALPDKIANETDLKHLAEIALGVPHAGAADFLYDHRDELRGEPNFAAFLKQVARYGNRDEAKGELLKLVVKLFQNDDMKQAVSVYRALQQGCQERGVPLGEEAKIPALALGMKALASEDSEVLQAGIDILMQMRDPLAVPLLDFVAADVKRGEAQRESAFNALLSYDRKTASELGLKLIKADSTPANLRDKVGQSLARTDDAAIHAALIEQLKTAPARLAGSIAAGLSASKSGSQLLLQAVETGKASARLLQERTVRERLRAAGVGDDRIAKLTQGIPTGDEATKQLMRDRQQAFAKFKPDAKMGAAIFVKNCAACHQIAGQGAKVAPQLDGIGIRGLERLLEDTLDPSRNVDGALRATELTLKDGRSFQGLFLRDDGAISVFADNAGKEVRFGKDDIEERRQLLISPMPANFAQTIPEGDFHHLMAYLLTQRPLEK